MPSTGTKIDRALVGADTTKDSGKDERYTHSVHGCSSSSMGQ
jgi:hypothetical protein